MSQHCVNQTKEIIYTNYKQGKRQSNWFYYSFLCNNNSNYTETDKDLMYNIGCKKVEIWIESITDICC